MADLKHGAVAIYTLAGEDHLRTILITPTVRRAYEYPIKAEELNRKIAAFRAALENPHGDSRALAQELYHMLMVPRPGGRFEAGAGGNIDVVAGRSAAVSSAGGFAGWETVSDRKYRLAVFTPASLLVGLKDTPAAAWNFLGMGVTRQYENLPPLPYVENELMGIVQTPDHSQGFLPGKVLIDDGFTRRNMMEQLRHGYSAVQIASHFVFHPAMGSRSFLLIGRW